MPRFTPADKAMPPHLLGQAAATQRVTHPDDVAFTTVFLCSVANTNTTGELVRVDVTFRLSEQIRGS